MHELDDGRNSLMPRGEIDKVKTPENANEIFESIIHDRTRPWTLGIFVAHMGEMQGRLAASDYAKHKEWVFNTHPDKIPSFKELVRVFFMLLVRCCTRLLL